ncbi:DUF4839 domain-containing protein [Streptomyces pimonensis]|uniref:DUF4839 domain-containing protein n=1 Tax=Streptomyces pimonensis TaxID=2860288 RepID=A0ABV4IYS3_9ACTN
MRGAWIRWCSRGTVFHLLALQCPGEGPQCPVRRQVPVGFEFRTRSRWRVDGAGVSPAVPHAREAVGVNSTFGGAAHGRRDQVRVVAEVGEFNAVQCLFHLDPISAEAR